MAIREIDELGNIQSEIDSLENLRSVPFDEYFGEMDLTDEQKEKRKQFSEDMMFAILTAFALMNRGYTKEQSIKYLYYSYVDTISNYAKVDSYLENYAGDMSESIIDTTAKNMDNPYFTSVDRAMFIAENESNTDMNYLEYVKAVNDGKTKKKWIDMKDKRERKTHIKVGSMVLPIERPFHVGDSLMQFPKDFSLGADAKEIINCRCSIMYY